MTDAPTLPPRISGLLITGIVGFGAHGTIWAGQWDGEDVAVRVVRRGEIPLQHQQSRLSRLHELRSTHVARVIYIHESDSEFVVISELIDGPALSTVRSSGIGLTMNEGWRVVADLCHGLSELHKYAIVHGDVSPANVQVRPATSGTQGRAVLIDLGGVQEWELGTPGFRAPEITTGSPPSTASDVWSAAKVGTWAVREGDRLQFAELLSQALDVDPVLRPTAAALAQIAGAKASQSIQLPDRASLAGAHLRARASHDPTRHARWRRKELSGALRGARAPQTSRRRRPSSNPLQARPLPNLQEKTQGRRGRSLEKRRSRHANPANGRTNRFLVAVLSVGLLIAGAVWRTHHAADGELGPVQATTQTTTKQKSDAAPDLGPGSALTSHSAPPATDDPLEAVEFLTALRDKALAHSDPHILARVTVPDSPAARFDNELLASFEGAKPTGLRSDLEVVNISGEAQRPLVTVELVQEPFRWQGGTKAGIHVARTPQRCALIELAQHEGQWRVFQVSACAAEEMSG